MIKLIPPKRRPDNFGSGHFNAPRGDHFHNGEDLAAWVGSIVLSNIAGRVTKIGYPYGDDLSFRYVQVTSGSGLDYRFFYVNPSVKVGDNIKVDDELGTVQDLNKRYDGITPHIHFEVKKSGEYLDPNDYL